MVVTRGMILAHTFPVGLNTVPVTVNQDMRILRPVQGVDARYLAWMLQGLEPVMLSLTDESAHGTKALRTDQWANLAVPVPPADEQQRIANFLDEQTARIDALIAEKEQLLKRLQEYRQSVATNAITQGVPGEHSAFATQPFLGSIPASWGYGKFRHYVQFRSGQVDPESEEYAGMILIAPNHIESGTGRLLQMETAAEQGAESGKYWCDAGDVVYSKIRPALRKVTLAPFDCLCSADMYPLKGVGPLTNEYLLWYLLSEPFSVFAAQESMRVAMPKLNRETLAEAIVPLPSPAEQERIVLYLRAMTSAIDELTTHVAEHIDRLREYRSSLISAAVTGQLDVGAHRPPAAEELAA